MFITMFTSLVIDENIHDKEIFSFSHNYEFEKCSLRTLKSEMIKQLIRIKVGLTKKWNKDIKLSDVGKQMKTE